MEVKIAHARVEDLPGIAAVVVRAWRATFAGLLRASFLANLNVETQLLRHQNAFAKPGAIYHVAKVADQVVGFASGGPTRHEAFVEPNELYALYLLPTWQRQGLGRQLFNRLSSELQKPERLGLLALVLANNPNQGFYHRLGGVRHAAQDIELGGQVVAQYAFLWSENVAFHTLRSHTTHSSI